MRQSLSCSQISSCLPGLTSSFHFNFPFFLLFFFKFRCPFQLRFSRGSYHERFSKRVLLAFIPCFSKSPEPKVPVKKVSDFLASHYFNLCFFFVSWKVSKWLLGSFLSFCAIWCQWLLRALIAFFLQRVSTMKVWHLLVSHFPSFVSF